MGFIEITKTILDKAFTENGGVANRTTGSYCLDYFAAIGGMRFEPKKALNLFLLAYRENPILALKILFYTRDIRGGLGERSIFRVTINLLANMYPEVAEQLIEYIPTIGRWDDLLVLFDTPLRKNVVSVIKNQLEEDVKNNEANKPISLLAKWMPSINTSSIEVRTLANRLSASLGMKHEEYRKLLSKLRKGVIIENNLREKDYTFNYSTVPGCAALKYQKAFLKNDRERYVEYLESLQANQTKFNIDTIYPYQIIRKFEKHYSTDLHDPKIVALNTIWDNFNKEEVAGKTIVVRDGSGSMYDNNPISAAEVATSLTMLLAERLTGQFKNKFITFSSRPELIELPDVTPFEKYNFLRGYNDCSNTDIKKVYDLILNVYKNEEFKREDALDRIIIISDMEFDKIPNYDNTAYNYFKEKFSELGYEIPEIIFWNVRCRNIHFPATLEDLNVKLVSGATPMLIDAITKNSECNAYDLMLKVLEPYSYLDRISL